MKSNKVNYVVVGIFVVSMLVASLAAIVILSGGSGDRDSYFTSYRDVSDLRFGSRVLYMGYPVGQVESISPEWSDDGELRFKVLLSISTAWRNRIPSDSIAEIDAAGLLAAVVIDIRAGESDKSLPTGGILAGRERANIFAAMTDTANTIRDLTEEEVEPLIKQVSDYVDEFGLTLERDGTQMVEDLSNVANHLSNKSPTIIDNITTLSEELDRTVKQFQLIINDENTAKFDTLLDNSIDAVANVYDLTADDRLLGTLTNIERASKNLDDFTATANLRLDDLLGEQTVHQVQLTLNDVSSAAKNIAVLSKDLEITRSKLENIITVMDDSATSNQEDVRQSVKNLRHTLQSISNRIDTMTYNLEGASRNMYEFSRSIRQNPGLLFGSRAPSGP